MHNYQHFLLLGRILEFGILFLFFVEFGFLFSVVTRIDFNVRNSTISFIQIYANLSVGFNVRNSTISFIQIYADLSVGVEFFIFSFVICLVFSTLDVINALVSPPEIDRSDSFFLAAKM